MRDLETPTIEEQEQRWKKAQETQQMNEQKIQYIKGNYKVFGIGSIIYGILYAVLMYKNPMSVTFPIFIAITLGICVFVLKKFRITIKKEGYFLMGAIQLLAVAVCLTTSQAIIAFNKVAIFLLLFFFMLEQVYDTKGWQVGKNIGKLFLRMIDIFMYYGKPWSHLFAFSLGKEEAKTKTRKHVLIGVAVAIPLVLIVCGLLANADRMFESFFQWIFENILSVDAMAIIFWIVIVYSLMYSFICASVTTKEGVVETNEKFPAAVGNTFTIIVAVIYIGFCVLQVWQVFGGYYDGMSHSKFAREGFFELLFVSAINLFIVIICVELFERSKILDAVLIIISGCTYILIASSAYRMILYVDRYRLTFLRIFVLWFLVVLAIWMTGAIIYIKKRNWNYFKFSVCVITVMYLIFVYANPDKIIMKYNVQYNEILNSEDVDYFRHNIEPKALLAEIEKVEAKLAPEDKTEISYELAEYCNRIIIRGDRSSIRETNFALQEAYGYAKKYLRE